MFGIFRRKQRWHRLDDESPLNFATEDRESAQATPSSDELVKSLLEAARKKAEDLSPGSEVSVDLTERHPEIHHMEILASLMRPSFTSAYGVRFLSQLDNTFYFVKV